MLLLMLVCCGLDLRGLENFLLLVINLENLRASPSDVVANLKEIGSLEHARAFDLGEELLFWRKLNLFDVRLLLVLDLLDSLGQRL